MRQVWQTHTSLVSYTISERIFCECDPFETCSISCQVSSKLGRQGTEYFALTLASVLLRNKTEDQLRQGLSRVVATHRNNNADASFRITLVGCFQPQRGVDFEEVLLCVITTESGIIPEFSLSINPRMLSHFWDIFYVLGAE